MTLKRRTVGDVKACLRSPQYHALLAALTMPYQEQQLANVVSELIRQIARENETLPYSALGLADETPLTLGAGELLNKLENTVIALLNTVC